MKTRVGEEARTPGTEGGRRTTDVSGGLKPDRGRWSLAKKMTVVLRLLRGEDLETVSRETRVTVARLTKWRDTFLSHGQAALRSRSRDDRNEEIDRFKAKVGELTMENELLYDKIHRMEAKLPPARRRSRS